VTDSSLELRGVRKVVEEVKAAEPPPIRWAALECELFAELEGQIPADPVRSPKRRQAALLWAFAAAAIVGLGLAGQSALKRADNLAAPVESSSVNGRTWTKSHVNSTETRVGDHFVASHSDITIQDARLGTWTLFLGGEATLLKQAPLVLQLAQGELRAEITPGLQPDSFVVQAAQTRVAVKGTIFRVHRQPDRVHVDVERGTVSVSSLGAGRQAFELRAPASGDFALDASTGRVWEPNPTEWVNNARAKTAPMPAPALATRRVARANLARETLPTTLSLDQVGAGVDSLIRIASTCLSETVASNGQLSLTFVTQARLSVSAEGELSELELTPPLLPKASECLRQRTRSLNFGSSQKGAELFRRLEIEVSPREPAH